MKTTRLDDVITPLGEIALSHRRQLSDAMSLADQFVGLHLSGAAQIQATASRGRSDTALLLLSAHVFNVYTTTIELALEGRIDTAWHLTRALFDSQGLAFAVAADESQSEKFLNDDLRASAARKFAIQYLDRTGYDDISPIFGDRWKRNADAANLLAHVNVRHLGMLVTVDGSTIIPNYGGREDVKACRLLMALVHEEELLFLTWIEKFRMESLASAWRENFAKAKVAYMDFRQHPETVQMLGDPGYNSRPVQEETE